MPKMILKFRVGNIIFKKQLRLYSVKDIIHPNVVESLNTSNSNVTRKN